MQPEPVTADPAPPAPHGAPAIHLHAAALRYGGTVVFEAFDLTLPGGRTTCLLGPSGVGKTSLLRLIAGLAHGAQGEVAAQGEVEGEAVSRLASLMADQFSLFRPLGALSSLPGPAR